MSDRANKTLRIVLAVVVLTNPLAWVLAVLAFNALLVYVGVSLLIEASRWQMTVKVSRPRRPRARTTPEPLVVDAAPVLIPTPPAGDALAEVGKQFQKSARRRPAESVAAAAPSTVGRVKANKKPKAAVKGKSPKAKGNKAPAAKRKEKSAR
jgi:hypothetical protein